MREGSVPRTGSSRHRPEAAHEARRERAPHRRVPVDTRAENEKKKTAPAEAEAVMVFS